MDASIDFSGVLRGSIADGGGGGGGDSVVITPVVTSGTKIADVSVNGIDKDLYCPTVTPTQVIVTSTQQSGTKIGSVEVNGDEVDLYAPSPTNVSVTPAINSGTKIADISVNGVNKELYAPAINHVYSNTEQVVGVWVDGRPIYEKTFMFNQQVITDNAWSNNILGTAGSGIKIIDYNGTFGLQNTTPCYAKFNYYRSSTEFFTATFTYTLDDINVRPNINASVDVTLDRCIILYIKDSDSIISF